MSAAVVREFQVLKMVNMETGRILKVMFCCFHVLKRIWL